MTEEEKALRQALIRSQLPAPKEKKFTIILSPRQQKALDFLRLDLEMTKANVMRKALYDLYERRKKAQKV